MKVNKTIFVKDYITTDYIFVVSSKVVDMNLKFMNL